ncbi:MAG: glycosyltransferase family A protein [Fimbriimonadaceae bacterium]
MAVVIPTYNQRPFLMQAIESAWNQTLPPDEVIVVDNASADGTEELCRSLGDRIRYIRLPENRGAAAARNAGTAATDCPIVVYLDGDDVMREDCLEARIPLIADDPDAGLVLGTMLIVSEELTPIAEEPQSYKKLRRITFDAAVREPNCPTGGLVVRKSVLDGIGGWDETLWNAQDCDLLIRMAAASTCIVDPEPRALYRQIAGSLSKNGKRVLLHFRNMLEKNRALAKDPGRYDRLARLAYRDKAAHYVFGPIWNDPQPRKLARMLAEIRADRELAMPFLIWVGAAVRGKVRRLAGRIRAERARSGGSNRR